MPARLLILCALCLGVGAAAQAQLTSRTLAWQGAQRTWYEHLPQGYDGSRPLPLVVALHGYSDSGDKFAALSQWEAVADANGFIVVFPNGGLTVGDDFGWNNFVFDGSAPDDVGFLLALIQQLETDYRVDADRVFMAGFSNGAGMTNNFAGVHSGVLAGIAPVSGGWLTAFDVPESDMHPAAPLPVWVWGNEHDDFQNGSETMDVEEQQQLQYWVAFNGDRASPNLMTAPPYETRVYPGGGAEARFTLYEGGEHAYQPGTSAKLWTDFFAHLSRQARYTPPLAFHDWQLRYFSADELTHPEISGEAADPDGDGLSNLLEYALVSDPRRNDATNSPTPGVVGQSLLTLSFRSQPAAADLDYQVEISDDLGRTWAARGTRTDAAGGDTLGVHGAVVQDDVPLGTGNRLVRLRVTLRP